MPATWAFSKIPLPLQIQVSSLLHPIHAVVSFITCSLVLLFGRSMALFKTRVEQVIREDAARSALLEVRFFLEFPA